MRLTARTDYALRVLIFLAVSPQERVRVSDIARAYGISQHRIAKVVQQLQRHGFISSVRGKRGGISLNHAIDAISIGSVVRQLEGTDHLVECFSPDGHCGIEGACTLPRALREAYEAFVTALERYSLEDIVSKRDRALRTALRLDAPLAVD